MEGTNLCLDDEQYEEISGARLAQTRQQILIAVTLTLLGLLIFAIIIVALYFNYKTKRNRRKEMLKSSYANIKAPDMKVRLWLP